MPIPPEQLAILSQWLESRAAALDEHVATVRASLEGDSRHGLAEGEDAANESVFSGLADTRLERELSELREIHLASQRIADASYGRCAACGREIAPRRLLAYPIARRCIACQDEAERLRTASFTARPSPAGHE